MPYYGRPVETAYEAVGFGYNRDVITGLLRERYGFDGVVCTDWGLVSDMTLPDGSIWDAKAWGVENLLHEERIAKISTPVATSLAVSGFRKWSSRSASHEATRSSASRSHS
jgi:beta-glucosidase-like glycosyl hydrolase